MKLLLAYGALVDRPTSQGITPLMAAAGIGSTTIDIRARFRNEDQCIALGKSGGTGRIGLSAAEPHPETAALLQKLQARN